MKALSRFAGRSEHLLLVCLQILIFLPGLVAHSDAYPTDDQEVAGSRCRSGTILSLRLIMKSFLRPLIQEGKLSVTCERMCTEYWLTS